METRVDKNQLSSEALLGSNVQQDRSGKIQTSRDDRVIILGK